MIPIIIFTNKIQKDHLQLTILDVGQGLATVIRTTNHTLVYDTGPAYGESDAGENVVLPYLYYQGVHKIHMLVISHADNDHIGGAASVIKAMQVNSIQTSIPDKIPTQVTQFCQAGKQWTWDNIHLQFIYPYKKPLRSKNDRPPAYCKSK